MSNNFEPFGSQPFPPIDPDNRKDLKNRKTKAVRDKTTRRGVNTQRTLFLIFALLAGLLATVAVTASSPSTFVARTTTAVNSLVPMSADQWEVVSVDPEFVENGAWSGDNADQLILDVKEAIDGKRVGVQLVSGQQLRPTLFIDKIELSTPLTVDERLISISARAGAAVVGTIRPGDRIDLYATAGQGIVGLLGSDVEVVSVSIDSDQLDSAAQAQLNQPDKTLSELVPGEPIPGTYVLRVSALDVAAYVAADVSGGIFISLRGASAGVTPGIVTDLISALCAKPGNTNGSVCRGR